MNEREKILESIKKGILSPVEGLDLLESLGLSDTESHSEEEASLASAMEDVQQEKSEEATTHSEEETDSFEEEESSTTIAPMAEDTFKTDEEDAAPEDAVKQEFERETLVEKDAKQSRSSDSVSSMIDEWENPSAANQQEADPVRAKIDEFDQALQTKKEALREKKEVFRELNLEVELGIISDENKKKYDELAMELEALEEEIELLKHERLAIDEDLFVTLERPQVSESFFDTPEDFEEKKHRPLEPPHVQPKDLGSRIGWMVNKAAKTVSDTVNNEFDWKSINQKFYGTEKTHFTHQFTFSHVDAKSINIKLAKGKVIIKTWEDETIKDVKVEASISLLGRMPESDPLEAFLERSQVDVNTHQVLFHVPNKRVDAKLTFYLPKRQYADLSVRLLNGDLMIEDLVAKNVAIKATNGTLLVKGLEASMVEFEGTSNEIELRGGRIAAATLETVTGTIVSQAEVLRAEYSLINGDIKLSAGNKDLKKIEAHSVNGNVKVSLPKTIGIEGIAKTGSGMINYRFANCETVQERSGETQKVLHFNRQAADAASINISSKVGNIFLKDYDK